MTEIPRPILGGHESFPLRYGWLKKGFDAVREDPTAFARKDASTLLGVGVNMVRSIRHWCLATGVVSASPGSRLTDLVPTPLGEALLADNGFDPYLEDSGTLWLLHWQIVSNRTRGLIWYLSFTTYPEVEFSKDHLLHHVGRQLDRLGVQTTENVLRRETDCCLRSYLPAQSRRSKVHDVADWETGVDCPLLELEVLQVTPSDGLYRFRVGPKPSLPAPIMGFALLQHWKAVGSHRRTMTVDECLYQPGSPGQAFKLDENSTMAYLEELAAISNGMVQIQETSGLRQIYFKISPEDIDRLGLKFLEAHYARVC
jgi:hypothetical protein